MVDVLIRLRFLSLIGFLIYLVAGLVAPATADNPVPREGLDAIKNILILPLEIAIYRLLILGETTSGYNLAIFDLRFQRLLGWTVGLWALLNLPPYLAGLITPSEDANAIATIATVVAAIALVVRITVLFPAIAVEAPGASLANALADTRGRSWSILKSYFLVLLPALLVLVVGLAAFGLVSDIPDLSTGWDIMGIAFVSAIEFLITVLTTVATSRLFDWIGHQVKGQPTSPGPA
jgi:hypothetical protein